MSDQIFPTPTDRQNLRDTFRAHGIQSAFVEFSGGGDSGEIQGVTFYSVPQPLSVRYDTAHALLDAAKATIESWDERSQWVEGSGWKRETIREFTTLEKHMERLCYAALETTGLDWYNNEGGQGHLTITFNDRGELDFDLEVDINVVEVQSHNFNFSGTDDELEAA